MCKSLFTENALCFAYNKVNSSDFLVNKRNSRNKCNGFYYGYRLNCNTYDIYVRTENHWFITVV